MASKRTPRPCHIWQTTGAKSTRLRRALRRHGGYVRNRLRICSKCGRVEEVNAE